MPQAHDRGGWPTDEPIDRSGPPDWRTGSGGPAPVVGAVRAAGLVNVDELRRGIESLPPDQYEALSYFERWAASVEAILVEKGVLTTEEIDRRVADIEERWE